MAEPGAGQDGGHTRVLIADDNDTVRRTLEFVLQTFEDIEVVGLAANGEEAVRLTGELLPDVVLMDLLMPVMDGVQATRLIRQRYPRVHVVALTNSTDTALRQQVLEAGAGCYLHKSASSDEIAECIRAARA